MGNKRIGVAITGAGLAALGAWRLTGSGVELISLDAGLARSYLLHIASGAFFGWGCTAAAFDTDSWRSPLRILGVVSPILFLAVIHQTKTVINDGPAAVAMGFALIAGGLLARARVR